MARGERERWSGERAEGRPVPASPGGSDRGPRFYAFPDNHEPRAERALPSTAYRVPMNTSPATSELGMEHGTRRARPSSPNPLGLQSAGAFEHDPSRYCPLQMTPGGWTAGDYLDPGLQRGRVATRGQRACSVRTSQGGGHWDSSRCVRSQMRHGGNVRLPRRGRPQPSPKATGRGLRTRRLAAKLNAWQVSADATCSVSSRTRTRRRRRTGRGCRPGTCARW